AAKLACRRRAAPAHRRSRPDAARVQPAAGVQLLRSGPRFATNRPRRAGEMVSRRAHLACRGPAGGRRALERDPRPLVDRGRTEEADCRRKSRLRPVIAAGLMSHAVRTISIKLEERPLSCTRVVTRRSSVHWPGLRLFPAL